MLKEMIKTSLLLSDALLGLLPQVVKDPLKNGRNAVLKTIANSLQEFTGKVDTPATSQTSRNITID